VDLSQEEIRVLGCLVEKQLTTPQQYPLTLNALMLGCNQSSNRFPIVSYDESTTESAVTSAKSKGFARFVHPSHGRSAIRYAHMLEEAVDVDRRQLALLSTLMLRGPQTPGELRSRTERTEKFEDLPDIERELGRLSERDDPLVLRLDRQPGQKEVRFAHLLAGSVQEHTAPPAPQVVGSQREPLDSRQRSRSGEEPLADVVAQLREEVQRLRHDLDELRSQLGA
jgi:uncharacterized protein YceH (UPF0502 family)